MENRSVIPPLPEGFYLVPNEGPSKPLRARNLNGEELELTPDELPQKAIDTNPLMNPQEKLAPRQPKAIDRTQTGTTPTMQNPNVMTPRTTPEEAPDRPGILGGVREAVERTAYGYMSGAGTMPMETARFAENVFTQMDKTPEEAKAMLETKQKDYEGFQPVEAHREGMKQLASVMGESKQSKESSVRGGILSGFESLGAMLGAASWGAIGGVKAAFEGVNILFGGSQANETYERLVMEGGVDPKTAALSAVADGAVTYGVEKYSNALFANRFLRGMGVDLGEGIAKGMNIPQMLGADGWKGLLKNFGKQLLTEVAEEEIQGGFSAWLRKTVGGLNEDWDNFTSLDGQTRLALGTIIATGIFAGSTGMYNKYRGDATVQALIDPKTDPKVRLMIANNLYNAVKDNKEVAHLAEPFRGVVFDSVMNNTPVPIDMPLADMAHAFNELKSASSIDMKTGKMIIPPAYLENITSALNRLQNKPNLAQKQQAQEDLNIAMRSYPVNMKKPAPKTAQTTAQTAQNTAPITTVPISKLNEAYAKGEDATQYSMKEEPSENVFTPENITQKSELPEGAVFVFGSNTQGRHGKGAAKVAKEQFGAILGRASGRQGNAFAIVTKDLTGAKPKEEMLGEIKSGLLNLSTEARVNPQTPYYLTRIGTGLAGFSEEEVKKQVAEAGLPDNVILPKGWSRKPVTKTGTSIVKATRHMYGSVQEESSYDVLAMRGPNGETMATVKPEDYGKKDSGWLGNPITAKPGENRESAEFRERASSEFGKLLHEKAESDPEFKKAVLSLKGKRIGYYKPEVRNHVEEILKYIEEASEEVTGKYEVSSAGDKRFSALYAKLKDGRTIEEAYQVGVKGYSSVKEGKGKPPKTSMSKEETWKRYKALWKQWASENPDLIEDLRMKSKGKTLTDKFAKTEISQARALTEILAETEKKGLKTFSDLPAYNESQSNMVYAGVGSRNTPPEILQEMSKVAKELESRGYTLRTGEAEGADKAFRESVEKKEVFLKTDATDETRKIAKEVHPNPHALRPGWGLDLMARNTNQIFGKNLDTPVDFVLAWTPLNNKGEVVTHASQRFYGGKDSPNNTGGTGQAIALASLKGIPVINMADPNWRSQLELILEDSQEEWVSLEGKFHHPLWMKYHNLGAEKTSHNEYVMEEKEVKGTFSLFNGKRGNLKKHLSIKMEDADQDMISIVLPDDIVGTPVEGNSTISISGTLQKVVSRKGKIFYRGKQGTRFDLSNMREKLGVEEPTPSQEVVDLFDRELELIQMETYLTENQKKEKALLLSIATLEQQIGKLLDEKSEDTDTTVSLLSRREEMYDIFRKMAEGNIELSKKIVSLKDSYEKERWTAEEDKIVRDLREHENLDVDEKYRSLFIGFEEKDLWPVTLEFFHKAYSDLMKQLGWSFSSSLEHITARFKAYPVKVNKVIYSDLVDATKSAVTEKVLRDYDYKSVQNLLESITPSGSISPRRPIFNVKSNLGHKEVERVSRKGKKYMGKVPMTWGNPELAAKVKQIYDITSKWITRNGLWSYMRHLHEAGPGGISELNRLLGNTRKDELGKMSLEKSLFEEVMTTWARAEALMETYRTGKEKKFWQKRPLMASKEKVMKGRRGKSWGVYGTYRLLDKDGTILSSYRAPLGELTTGTVLSMASFVLDSHMNRELRYIYGGVEAPSQDVKKLEGKTEEEEYPGQKQIREMLDKDTGKSLPDRRLTSDILKKIFNLQSPFIKGAIKEGLLNEKDAEDAVSSFFFNDPYTEYRREQVRPEDIGDTGITEDEAAEFRRSLDAGQVFSPGQIGEGFEVYTEEPYFNEDESFYLQSRLADISDNKVIQDTIAEMREVSSRGMSILLGRKIEDYKWRKYTETAVERAIIKISKILEDKKDTFMGKALGIQSVLLDLTQEQSVYLSMVADEKGIESKFEYMLAKSLLEGVIDQQAIDDHITGRSLSTFSKFVKNPGMTSTYRRLWGNRIENVPYPGEKDGKIPVKILSWDDPENVFNQNHIAARLYSEIKTVYGMDEAMKALALFFHTLNNLRTNKYASDMSKESIQKAEWMAYRYSYGYEKIYSGTLMRSYERELSKLMAYKDRHVENALRPGMTIEGHIVPLVKSEVLKVLKFATDTSLSLFLNIPNPKTGRYGNADPVGSVPFSEGSKVLDAIEMLSDTVKKGHIDVLLLSEANNDWGEMKRRTNRIMELSEKVKDRSITRKELDELQRETDIAYLDSEMILSGSALPRQFNETVSPLNWKSTYMRNTSVGDLRILFMKRGNLFQKVAEITGRTEIISEVFARQQDIARKGWVAEATKMFNAWKELTSEDREYYQAEIPLINSVAKPQRRMFYTKEIEYADLLDIVSYIDLLELGVMTQLERAKTSQTVFSQSSEEPIIDVHEAYLKAQSILAEKGPRSETAEKLLKEAVSLIDRALDWQGANIKYKKNISSALVSAIYGAKQLTRLVPKILTSDQKLEIVDKIIDDMAEDLAHVSPGAVKGKQKEMYDIQEENIIAGEAITNMARIFGTVQFPVEAGLDDRLWGTISLASHLRKEELKKRQAGIPTPLTKFWSAIDSLQQMKLGDKKVVTTKQQGEINKYANQIKVAIRQMQGNLLDYTQEAIRKASESMQFSIGPAVKEYAARTGQDSQTVSEAAGASLAAVASVINRITGGNIPINFVSPEVIAEGWAEARKMNLEAAMEGRTFYGSFQLDIDLKEAAGLINMSLLNTEDEMWDTAFHEAYHGIERMIQILSKYADNPEVRKTFSDLYSRLSGDPEQAAKDFAAMYRSKTTQIPQKSRLAISLIKRMMERLRAFIKSLLTGLNWRNQLTLDKVKTFSHQELMDFFFSGEFGTLFNQQKLSTSLTEARQALLQLVTNKYAYQLAYEDNPSEMESGKEYTYMSVPEKYQRVYEDIDPNRPVSFVWSGFRTGEQIWYFRDTMEPLNLNDTMELSEIFNQDTQYSIRDIASAIRNMMNTPSPTASSRYDTLSSDWIGNTALRIKKNANIADRVTNLSAQLSRVVDKRLIEGLKLPFTRGVDAARVTLEGARYLRTVLYYLHDINRTPSNRVAFVRLRNAMNTLTKEQFLTRNTGWTNTTYDEAKRILTAVHEFESKVANNTEAQRIISEIYSALESAYTEIGGAAGTLGIINHFIGRYQSRVVQRPVGEKWKPSTQVSVGDLFTAEDGKTYRALNSGVTGTTQPTGTAARIQDGAVRWRFVTEEDDDSMGGVGGFRRSTGHAIRRTFTNIASAWANGYEIVNDDIASNFKEYADEVSVAIENNLLLRAATGYGLRGQLPNTTPAVTEGGEPIFSIGEPGTTTTGRSYKTIDNPNFFVWDSIDQSKWIDNDSDYKQVFGPDNTVTYYKKKKVYIHPDYSSRFESMMDKTSPIRRNVVLRWLLKYNAELKRIILASSLFHVFAFIRQYWFGTPYMFLGKKARDFRREHGMSMNPFKAWKSGYDLISKLNSGTLTRANLTPEMRVQLETLELLINNGLTLGNVQDWGEFEEMRKEKSVFAKASKGVKGKAGEIVRNIDGFVRANEVMLFKYFGNGLKVLSSMAMYTYLQRKYAEDPELLSLTPMERNRKLAGYAAEFANANFGGLGTSMYRNSKNPLVRAWFSPLMTDIKRLSLLAPDWTESNLIAMKKLIPKIGSSDKFEKAAYAYFGRALLARGVTTIILSNILVALIAGGSDYDDDDVWERLTKGWEEGDNLYEKLKGVIEVDVTPLYRLLGGDEKEVTKRYNVIGHFIDNIKAVTTPVSFLKGKMAAVPKVVFDAYYGANFKGETFTTFRELFGIDYDKGRYLRTTGTHKVGDPKWGKYFLEPTKFGEATSVTFDTLMSFLFYETKAVGMPIQMQELTNVAFGYSGWFEAIARMALGQQISSTYLPRKEAPYLAKVFGKKDDIDRYLNARWMKISKEWDKEALEYAKSGEDFPIKKVLDYDKRIRELNKERREYRLKGKKLSTLRKREKELRRNPTPSMPGYQDWMDEE